MSVPISVNIFLYDNSPQLTKCCQGDSSVLRTCAHHARHPNQAGEMAEERTRS